jgi:hypothetical protein
MPKQNIMAVLETKRAVSLLLTPTFVDDRYRQVSGLWIVKVRNGMSGHPAEPIR